MKSRFPVSFKENCTLWMSVFIEWLLLLPVWLVLQTYLQPDAGALRWIYLLPVLAAAGVLLRNKCSRLGKQLLAALVLGVLAGGATGTLTLIGLPLVAGAALSAFLGMTAASRVNRLRFYIGGIALYFVASIAFSRIPDLQPNVMILTWSGSLCLVLALLDSNSSHLRYSSLNGDAARLPEGLRRHNRLFVVGFIILAALLAAGGGKAVGTLLWNAVRGFFAWLSRLSSGSEEAPPEQAPPEAMPSLPAAEPGEPGLLSLILNIGFYILGAAVLLAIFYFILRWLYRNTGGLLRRAIDRLISLLRRETPVTSAYQDEETSLFTWEQTVQDFRQYWRSKLAPASGRDRWEGMTGSRERIRWLYRHWLRARHEEGYKVKAYLTPQETAADVAAWSQDQKRKKHNGSDRLINEQLLGLYNKARYTEEELPELTAAEAAALKEQLKL
ncbi:hypothetical protein KDC22_15655 [Paenibacillus tritici]|uniref:hypothetical protein n=1 Tax=Paenibacillus tritici TaxID=1873425 RepID=UPI001BA57CA8|nr:hypothetical protein [Paenibacillus tritici]QUL57789.1 hypothetical protein KDC22_15655 [Paenibacillus tritici]